MLDRWHVLNDYELARSDVHARWSGHGSRVSVFDADLGCWVHSSVRPRSLAEADAIASRMVALLGKHRVAA